MATKAKTRAQALVWLMGVACAVALALASAQPARAWADAAVYTATMTASYANPATGAIEDAGGSSNAALGQSMAEGAVYPQGLLEADASGNMFLTMRLNLQDQVSGVSIQVSSNGVDYSTVQATITQSDSSANTADYRFAVPTDSMYVRCSMYVNPMGRDVVFFAYPSAYAAGNQGGFVQLVDTDPTPAAAAEEPAASAQSSDEDASAEGAAADDAEAQETDASQSAAVPTGASASSASSAAAAVTDDGSADAGIQEFNAEGDRVSDDATSKALSPRTTALIAVIILVVCAAVAAGVYVVRIRPRRARQAQAAAAAAGQAARRAAGGSIPTGDRTRPAPDAAPERGAAAKGEPDERTS